VSIQIQTFWDNARVDWKIIIDDSGELAVKDGGLIGY
jgi:hypothetical protein